VVSHGKPRDLICAMGLAIMGLSTIARTFLSRQKLGVNHRLIPQVRQLGKTPIISIRGECLGVRKCQDVDSFMTSGEPSGATTMVLSMRPPCSFMTPAACVSNARNFSIASFRTVRIATSVIGKGPSWVRLSARLGRAELGMEFLQLLSEVDWKVVAIQPTLNRIQRFPQQEYIVNLFSLFRKQRLHDSGGIFD